MRKYGSINNLIMWYLKLIVVKLKFPTLWDGGGDDLWMRLSDPSSFPGIIYFAFNNISVTEAIFIHTICATLLYFYFWMQDFYL